MRFLSLCAALAFVLSACQTTPMVSGSPKYAVVLLSDGTQKTELLGYVYDSNRLGMNEPLVFKSLKGRTICKGTYNLESQYEKGKIYLNCFDGRISGQGTFQVQGRRGNKSYGIAHMQTPKESLQIVFGMTAQEFESHRRAMVKK